MKTIFLTASFLITAIFAIGAFMQGFDGPITKGQNLPGVAKSSETPIQTVKDTRDLSKYGLVRIDEVQNLTGSELEKRQRIGHRYDKQEWVYKTINNPATAGVGRIRDLPVPAETPFAESSLVIVGEVIKATAYLSNDKEGVYTELTIRIDESIKDTDSVNTEQVTIDRGGGVVVYPSGQRVLYESSEEALPTVGSQYLFFLRRVDTNSNYEIVASYEFRGTKVIPMESGRSMEDFAKVDRRSFLNTVRQRLRQNLIKETQQDD